MQGQLMLNDILWDGEHIGRIIALSEDEFIVRSENGEWDGENTRPMPLTNELIVEKKVHEICEKNGLIIDFSRKRKLKISVIGKDGKVLISYFYPMPQYIHDLQHILRYFNCIEI